MDWLWAVGFIGACIVIGIAWEWLKERDNMAGKAASLGGEAAGGIGRLLLRLYGLAIVAAGVAILVLVGGDGDAGFYAAAAALAAYGTYVLFGGSWVIY